MTNANRTSAHKTPPWGKGPESEGVTFGAWLRQQREVRQVGLREVAESSKISIRYLEAFEQDRFDLLPAPVFSKGFLRQYASYVGLDPDEVLNHFLWASRESEPDQAEAEVAPEPPAERSILPLVVLAAVVVLALVALLLWSSRGREGSGEAPGPAAAPAADGTSSAALPALAEPPPPAVLPELPPPPPRPDVPLLVSVEFIRNCWVEAVVDGGRRRITQEFAQGEPLIIEAGSQVVFRKLGNAGGVKIEVNGLPYPLRGVEGQVAGPFRIDLDTAAALRSAAGSEAEGGGP